MDQDHQERIRQRAHEIWESEGRPEGRDAHHWSQAEQELRGQSHEGDQTMGGDQSGGVQPGDGGASGDEAGGDVVGGSQGGGNIHTPDAAQTMADESEPKLMEQPPAKKGRKSARSASTPYLNDGP